MSIFRWLTGNKDHHIVVAKGKGGHYWWQIVHREPSGRYRDVANSPTPGFALRKLAEDNAREFLDGIGADYLEVQEETECSAS